MNSSDSIAFDTSVFSGVRVFANFLVVNLHVFMFPSLMLDVPQIVFDLRAEEEPILSILLFPLFILSNYAVDSFLFLVGIYLQTPSVGNIPLRTTHYPMP